MPNPEQTAYPTIIRAAGQSLGWLVLAPIPWVGSALSRGRPQLGRPQNFRAAAGTKVAGSQLPARKARKTKHTVFKTVAFVRSATLPPSILPGSNRSPPGSRRRGHREGVLTKGSPRIGPRGVYAVGGAASVVAFGILAFGFAGAKTQPLEDATPPTG